MFTGKKRGGFDKGGEKKRRPHRLVVIRKRGEGEDLP